MKISPLNIILMLFVILGVPFLPLLISRRWDWWEAWVYALIFIFGFVASRVLAARQNPDLLSERGRFLQHENTKAWDKVLSPVVGLGSSLIPLTAGLDMLFGWSPPFSMPVKIMGLSMILAGFALGSYALIENRYFSGTVRLQSERGHRVVSSGPYRWMRHPGYAGSLLAYLGTPIFLEARWAFLPALLITATLIIRTALEDGFLQDELAGYRDYAGRVRFRLIPGVW
jgi:protein-S-isoprenylcysteine O-methyltransferase Ste14